MGLLQNLTGWHALILLAVVLLFFGASKLPNLARSVGQSARIFKSEVATHSDPKDDATPDAAPPVATPVATTAAPLTAAPVVTAPVVTAPVATAERL